MTAEPTPPIDLADLEAKARAATPGPWEATELVVHPSFNAPNQPFVEADGRKVARMSVGPGGDDVVAATFCTIGKYEREQANAAFIAAANPTVVLALVDLAAVTADLAKQVQWLDPNEPIGTIKVMHRGVPRYLFEVLAELATAGATGRKQEP